jgi:N-glycosylase/DNA lyase
MKEWLRVPLADWHPDKTIRCGQIFHWYQKENGYFLVRDKEVLHVQTTGEEVVFSGAIQNPDKWLRFLGLHIERDLSPYAKDPALVDALLYAKGLRLLLQDPFVTIISFILSANNHFARIHTGIHCMAAHWGEEIEEGVFSFPAPEQLAAVPPSRLRSLCTTGYRDRYIAQTAARIAEGSWDLSLPFSLSANEARKVLLQLPGVGPKVADCILLFAYGKGDVFPVDVWMHRVMRALYPNVEDGRKQIAEAAVQRFGEDAGLLQQMLFYYARDHKLGAGKKS